MVGIGVSAFGWSAVSIPISESAARASASAKPAPDPICSSRSLRMIQSLTEASANSTSTRRSSCSKTATIEPDIAGPGQLPSTSISIVRSKSNSRVNSPDCVSYVSASPNE